MHMINKTIFKSKLSEICYVSISFNKLKGGYMYWITKYEKEMILLLIMPIENWQKLTVIL